MVATACASLIVALPSPAPGQDSAGDPDFAVQGEYLGEIDGKPYGAHLVAEGDGKFAIRFYPGGLPGEGWRKTTPSRDGQGTRAGETVAFTAGDWEARLDSEHRLVVRPQGKEEDAGVLSRVERKSPTLGHRPPEDAVVLFDGKDLDQWKDGARITEDGLLREGAVSKPLFQAFHLHVEFRTPFRPKARGQERGNSGFYAQGRYEVQILDSFGLAGLHNECGGIYTVAEPAVNMCFPPLSWQTYDIDFTPAQFGADGKKTANARLTVRHNGVLIHEDVEADHATTAAPLGEGPEPGPVYFQDHGNPVRFRNIWIVPKD